MHEHKLHRLILIALSNESLHQHKSAFKVVYLNESIEMKINNLNFEIKKNLKITHSLRETTSNRIKLSKNKIYS